jgi:hypothetical protein
MTAALAARFPDWRLAVLPAAFCLARTYALRADEARPLEPVRAAFVALLDRWGYVAQVTTCERQYRPGLICRALFPIAPHPRTTNEPGMRLAFSIDLETPGGLEIARRWPRAWPEEVLTAPPRCKGHARWRRFAEDTDGCIALVRWVLERAAEEPNAAPVAAFPDPSPAPAVRKLRAPRPVVTSGRPPQCRRPLTLANHYL